jgi:hypothetical protein
MIGGEVVGIALGQVRLGFGALAQPQEAEGFAAQDVEQQAGGDLAVVRLALDQRACGEHQRLAHGGDGTPS